MVELGLEIGNRYYKHLALFGNQCLTDLNNALLYLTLIEWVKEFDEFLTMNDYVLISLKLNCLEGSSCLIPIDKDIEVSDLLSILHGTDLRATEDDVLRRTEENECYRISLMK